MLITNTEFSTLLDLQYEAQNSIHVDLENLAKTYENLQADRKDLYIRGLVGTYNIGHDNKPPYDFDIFCNGFKIVYPC